MDLEAAHYTDITKEDHFIMLNKTSHDTIHWLYRYYVKDPEVLDRLKDILDRMKEINDGLL